ncbi:hypothetical protein [Alkalihalobacterium alkalinitrilicum]|uniref:hypothetical protein n=1 Tax=Alkalihalobacterium alkalinitrilicum TaxID=427920 RepID=UPI000995B063|nr:hypothetical protein [Alkalihalobacterium alkalinitrilicum]
MVITKEDQTTIHQFVLLTIARKALEKDLEQLKASSLKLQPAYLNLTTTVLDQLSKELGVIKRYMKQKELKVEVGKNDGTFSYYHYFCRGYEGQNHYLNVNLKNQVTQYITNCFANGVK